MKDSLKSLTNYVLSFLLIAAGLAFVIFYMKAANKNIEGLDVKQMQGQGMLIGGLLLFVIGILSLPIIVQKISKTIKIVLTILAVIGVAFTANAVIKSLQTEIDFTNKLVEYKTNVVQDLKDIREAETAFKKVNKRYTADIQGELVPFIKAKVIPKQDNYGLFLESDSTFIGNKNPVEASYWELDLIIKKSDLDSVALDYSKKMEKKITASDLLTMINKNEVGHKIKDTLYVSLWDTKFSDEVRDNQKLPKIDLDKFHMNPDGVPYLIEVGSVNQAVGSENVRLPTICVKDPTPFGRENVVKDTLQFGDVLNAHTDGNWRLIR